MKKSLLSVAAIAVFGLLFSSIAFSQNDQMVSAAGNMYVISAKAGGINYVEGKVSVARKDGTSGPLRKSDNIEIGEKISTGADGKAEILLNPGSFVRLGMNAEFEFVTTDLDNLQLKLSAGSAIFEVYADNEFKVTLDLPDADIVLTKSGVYRVDVLSNGSGKLSVWKGRVVFDDQELKAGKWAVVQRTNALAATKFDRDNKDAFDIWSDLRAKEASRINKQLQRNALTNSLMNSFNLGGWNMFNTFGVWVFDPFTGRWCFLPFGMGWSSPYGYGYNFNIYHCSLPPRVYTPPTPNTPPVTSNNPNNMTQQQAQIREERRRNMHTPTFQRFENNTRVSSGGGRRIDDNPNSGSSSSSSDGGGWNNTRDRSGPTFTPSQSSPTRSEPTRSEPTFTPAVPQTRTETKVVKDN